MAEKDILEKILMSYADVFADCENALAYGGQRRLEAEDLRPAPTESFYRGKGRMHCQFSDVSAYLMEEGEICLQYIIGNESQLEGRQVLRKASYQGGVYRSQLESGRPVYPVIGMVLDWTGKRSRIPRSLHKLIPPGRVSPEDLARVDDVRLEVYHMKNLPKKVRKRFTSDLGFVVDYLNEGSFESRRGQRIVHVEALCGMMEALTGDSRFCEQVEELLKRQAEGKEIVMCEYIDMLEARGEARGISIGEARGISIGEARGISIGEARGISIGEARGEAKGISIGEARGISIGEAKGEERLANLIEILSKERRYEEIAIISRNKTKRHELYRHYGI